MTSMKSAHVMRNTGEPRVLTGRGSSSAALSLKMGFTLSAMFDAFLGQFTVYFTAFLLAVMLKMFKWENITFVIDLIVNIELYVIHHN